MEATVAEFGNGDIIRIKEHGNSNYIGFELEITDVREPDDPPYNGQVPDGETTPHSGLCVTYCAG